MLPKIRPMRLRQVKEPFDHPDYIFELKHDGFRALVYLPDRRVQKDPKSALAGIFEVFVCPISGSILPKPQPQGGHQCGTQSGRLLP